MIFGALLVDQFGEYRVYHGKLAYDDSREYFVTGPTMTGRIAPIGSYWNVGDAIRSARQMSRKRKQHGEGVDSVG